MSNAPRPRIRAAAVALAVTVACVPAGGPVLDKTAQLARFDWWDNRDFDWYSEHIPFLETPDPEIDATYYYRWEVLTKHLIYGSVEHGYTFTEFIDRPFWSGTYGAISCPLGHQFYEVRWLKDRRVIEDFARYWFEVPGAQPRSYSNWYADSLWATYQVLGDRELIIDLLPHMERQYAGWIEERWDAEHEMFRWDGMHDGMETNIDSRQTPQWFDGAEGYRPTLNSYLFADARAISKAAALAGDDAKALRYAERAVALKQRVQEELWDPEREFFFQQFARDEATVDDPWPGATGQQSMNAAVSGARTPAASGAPIRAKTLTYESGPWAGSEYGREEIGFVPWQFNLPDPGYEAAWKFLMDPERFKAPFGPTTTEQNDPLYYVSPRCCVWSGNSWPYATTQTLAALANLLNDYEQEHVDQHDYFELLRTYALTHRKQGRPYIAEAADPETGSWSGHDKFFHSEHYLHSGFIDLVITGLIGLRPRDDDVLEINPLVPDTWDYFALDDVRYRGHRLAVVWDRDGSHYGRGAGLRVFLNGELLGSAPQIGVLSLSLPEAGTSRPNRPVNYAANNGKSWYPHASASSAVPVTPPAWAVDGQYWYHRSPPNRWVPDSDSESDWFQVDFGAKRTIDTVKLYLLDDTILVPDFVAEDAPERIVASGQPTVAAPAAVRVMVGNGSEWLDIAAQRRSLPEPVGRRANVVSFPPIEAVAVRVVLEHRPGTRAGLSEIEIWGRGDRLLEPTVAAAPNLAYNPTGQGYPRATASYSSPDSAAAMVNDGELAFNYYTRKRWSAQGSPNGSDWIEIDFGEERDIGGADLYLWAWESRGTASPAAYRIEVWDGASWHEVPNARRHPEQAASMALNRVEFDPVATTRLRVVFDHALPDATAVSEIIVWAPDR